MSKKIILSELPYSHTALEPFISGKVMELHHDKHHNAYVVGANTAAEQLQEARDKEDYSKVNQLSKNYAFNFAGVVNHTAFFENMTSPERILSNKEVEGAAEGTDGNFYSNKFAGPIGNLKTAIEEKWGSFANFKKHFSAAASGVQGSGWALLVFNELESSVEIVQLYDHQANLALGLKPVLFLDVWEHAYYLDYLNLRANYIDAWWTLVNWEDAETRFNAAKVN